MKKAKRQHSPGPWAILDIPTHDSISVYQSRNPIRNFHIATVMDYASANREVSEAEFQRCLANAQLIAAAPELLEALEKIAEEAAREARNIGDSARRGDQSKADTFRFIRDEALKAIKKARGEI